MRKPNVLCFIPYFLIIYLLSGITQAETQPPSQGNFALPSAQQPGPFTSFGQNIIDKNQLQLFVDFDYLKSVDEYSVQVPFNALYGLSDQASFLVTLPWTVNYVDKFYHSSGVGDISFQVEYVLYEKSNASYDDQITLVNGLTLPTGSFKKSPTDTGATTVFIGTTFSRMSVNWLLFASPGISWATKNKNIQLGTEYLYQCGIGRNFHSVPGQYIFFLLGELNGTYTEKNKVSGYSIPDSGGNIIYATPSLWFSTKQWFIQLGVSFPVSQYWNGDQNKNNYVASATTGWTFY
ncbi:hypothetical protein [Legionella clemsonensis]|uniref:MetA-pathway of phenol degradation n=1 Tax=Legionella clemsonensis TaxID=1867846 RepID=A0A222P258_9GAMM|nr:hypothetical protein [Legionella clemsonensis]ASQ45940.1 hypothetical protein clem_06925 [Legionella clemsonensis]